MQATKAKQIAPSFPGRSAQAPDDPSGYTHQACCCMSVEVALAMQSVTHAWPEFPPHPVESSRIGNKLAESFDFKQVFRVIACERVNCLKNRC